MTDLYSFERSDRWLIDNIERAALLLGIVAFVVNVGVLNTNKDPVGWLLFGLTLIVACLSNELIFRRFAYRMDFDLGTNEVTFYFYRRKGSLTVRLDEIQDITLGAYIRVELKDRKVYYNEVTNKELIAFLGKLKPLTWTPLGRLLFKYW